MMLGLHFDTAGAYDERPTYRVASRRIVGRGQEAADARPGHGLCWPVACV